MSPSLFVLDKPVDDWSEGDVQIFLKNNQQKYHLKDASINLIVELEFTGMGLLTIREDELIGYGMNRGPARSVICLITALKLAKGLSEPGKETRISFSNYANLLTVLSSLKPLLLVSETRVLFSNYAYLLTALSSLKPTPLPLVWKFRFVTIAFRLIYTNSYQRS